MHSKIENLRHTLSGIEDEHLREMLQALLIDRFQLKFHRETKTGNIYLLERNGKTLELHPAGVSSAEGGFAAQPRSFGSIGYAGGAWVIRSTTIPQLAKFASEYVLHVPVVDRTELNGAFDYRQRVPDAEPKYGDNTDSFLQLLSKLGLKLERSKGPVESFVIDRAAKPSSN